MTRIYCERCCFWSDQLAKHEHGTMFAMCLNLGSPKVATYTAEDDGCTKGMKGEPLDSLRAKKVAA